METTKTQTALIILGIVFILAILLGGCPYYHVYQQRMAGKAELERANYNRLIKVAEANATYESSLKLAQSDIQRAKGVAQANTIIGNSLKNNPDYIYWKWVDELEKTTNQVIYVPSGKLGIPLPISEAGRAVTKNLLLTDSTEEK